MRLKDDSVSLDGLKPQTLFAMCVASEVFEAHGHELVITSARDGTHMEESKHYTGEAFDCRITDVLKPDWPLVRDEIKAKLRKHFDVVLELKPPHLHIEYDPKG